MSGTTLSRTARLLRGPCGLALSLGLGLAATGSVAATIVHVVQKGRAFDQRSITLQAGDSVSFSNEDEFIHQIFVTGNNFVYDSAEQPPGETISVTFPSPGQYVVNCHIHPKMRLDVTVE